MEDRGKDLDYFIARFAALADEAHKNGLSVAVLVENFDPISEQAGVWRLFRATPTTAIGLLQGALMDFQRGAAG